MATPLGFVDASEDGDAPFPAYSEDAPDAPPIDEGAPEAPPPDATPIAPPMTSLGDILRQAGKQGVQRQKQQLKPAPEKDNNEDKHRDELAAAIARRKEALSKVPFVEKKKDEQKPSELQNTILQGLAQLRKVDKRRASMDKSKGSMPSRDPATYTGKKWTPPAKTGGGKGEDDLSFAKFRCQSCRNPITNEQFLDTQSGIFHPECFVCMGCNKDLLGEYLTVNSIFFHPDCLNCSKCGDNLIDAPLLCSDKKLFCKKHTPRELCAECGERIEEGRVINNGDRNWHESCFVCCDCQTPLAGKMYVTHEGRFYCKPDYNKLFAVCCARCGTEADGPCLKINAPDGSQLTYHQKCYTCLRCNSSLRGKGSYAFQGDIYCKTHYVQLGK